VSLSASGLIALADLSTIAQRTAITGGSSWMDVLLLAPGLHYQQSADELAQGTGAQAVQAVETDQAGRVVKHTINNAATVQYIQRIARFGETITLDVGTLRAEAKKGRRKPAQGNHAAVMAQDESPDLGWLSQLLYLLSPALTVVALTFQILLQDCKHSHSFSSPQFCRVRHAGVRKREEGVRNGQGRWNENWGF
jgi:hypothetical protein